MGKGEDGSAENKTDDTSKKDAAPSNEPPTKTEDANKKNVDDLRKVIKVGQSEEEKPKQNEPASANPEDASRESLEQKRAILQSIKDFDFQIKKNSEEITTINKRLDSVAKDLDDLVSLYEIVSEQMNPFVGLSKVTKKRIEALENFSKDIEELKNRMNDLEGFAENAGINLQNLKEESQHMENKASKDHTSDGLSNEDMEIIIEKSFNELTVDERIDGAINEFLESLKEEKTN